MHHAKVQRSIMLECRRSDDSATACSRPNSGLQPPIVLRSFWSSASASHHFGSKRHRGLFDSHRPSIYFILPPIAPPAPLHSGPTCPLIPRPSPLPPLPPLPPSLPASLAICHFHSFLNCISSHLTSSSLISFHHMKCDAPCPMPHASMHPSPASRRLAACVSLTTGGPRPMVPCPGWMGVHRFLRPFLPSRERSCGPRTLFATRGFVLLSFDRRLYSRLQARPSLDPIVTRHLSSLSSAPRLALPPASFFGKFGQVSAMATLWFSPSSKFYPGLQNFGQLCPTSDVIHSTIYGIALGHSLLLLTI